MDLDNRLIIPPPSLRTGARNNMSDIEYIDNAKGLVLSIQKHLNKNNIKKTFENNYWFDGKTILDYGCGAGRMLIGLKALRCNYKSYIGVDVDKKRIKGLKDIYKNDTFYFFDIQNERYNPLGKASNEENFDIQIPNISKVDIIHMRSVFSHMLPFDVVNHLIALKKYLDKDSILYTSLFLNKNIEEEYIENPSFMKTDNSPLHIVVFNEEFFKKCLMDIGYDLISYETLFNQQTCIIKKRQ